MSKDQFEGQRLSLGSKLTYEGITDVASARQTFFRVIEQRSPTVISDLKSCVSAYALYAAFPYVFVPINGGVNPRPVPQLPFGPLNWESLSSAARLEQSFNDSPDFEQWKDQAKHETARLMANRHFQDAFQSNNPEAHQQHSHRMALLSQGQSLTQWEKEWLTHWAGKEIDFVANRIRGLRTAITAWSLKHHLEDRWIKDAAILLLARWDQNPKRAWEYPVTTTPTEDGVAIIIQPGKDFLMHDTLTTQMGGDLTTWIDTHGGLKPVFNPLPIPEPHANETSEEWQSRVSHYVSAGFEWVDPPIPSEPLLPAPLSWDPAIQDEGMWENEKFRFLAQIDAYVETYRQWAVTNAETQGWAKPKTKRKRTASPTAHFDWLVDYQIRHHSFSQIANGASSPVGFQQYHASTVGKAVRETARLIDLALRQ